MKQNGNAKAIFGFLILIVVIIGLVLAYSRMKSGVEETESGEKTAMEEDGSMKPGKTEARILIGVPAPLEASDAAYLYDEESKTVSPVEQPDGWRVTEINTEPKVEFSAVFNDPTVTRFTLGDVWDVVLRDRNSVAYQNPSFIGIVDESTAALQAEKDGRFILFVSAGGDIEEVYELPELYKIHGVYGNAVWITTALMGEGLEAEPQGPAHVIRIDRDGGESILTEDMVIDRLVAHENGSYAYRFADGSYKARQRGFLWEGSGTPLYWINADELLVSQGRTLKLVRLTASAQDTIGELSGTASAAGRIQFTAP